MAETPNEQERPEIDPVWRDLMRRMVADKQFGALVSTSLQHMLETNMERVLADVVRDYLVGNTAVGEGQREQIRLEVVPTQFQTHYIINYVLPNEPQDQPHTVICYWKNEKWHVMPLPGAPLS